MVNFLGNYACGRGLPPSAYFPSLIPPGFSFFQQAAKTTNPMMLLRHAREVACLSWVTPVSARLGAFSPHFPTSFGNFSRSRGHMVRRKGWPGRVENGIYLRRGDCQEEWDSGGEQGASWKPGALEGCRCQWVWDSILLPAIVG